ncbi:MAG: hypothetical protein Ta2G_19760 [Termitinemataceae bacterium]|nr:MAG: hypothetical protein Ta2G_19760 [Termitinemataceae bacterium]
MEYKAQVVLENYVKILSSLDGIECITLNEAALPAVLDPYFALILDVFYNGRIPDAIEREKLYGSEISAFESSGSKDRFFVGSLPVRFEFKPTQKIDELVDIAYTDTDSIWLVKDSGTYTYYRLVNGSLLFSRSSWIADVRSRLCNLGNNFWLNMRQAAQSKMEHFLSDLGAAVMQNDIFFYRMSAAGFIKNACLTLFCINREFEPSHRAYYKKVTNLPILSDSFAAQLETFLRVEAEQNLQKRYALAQGIAKGIVSL